MVSAFLPHGQAYKGSQITNKVGLVSMNLTNQTFNHNRSRNVTEPSHKQDGLAHDLPGEIEAIRAPASSCYHLSHFLIRAPHVYLLWVKKVT